jgi:hypothetical protein
MADKQSTPEHKMKKKYFEHKGEVFTELEKVGLIKKGKSVRNGREECLEAEKTDNSSEEEAVIDAL